MKVKDVFRNVISGAGVGNVASSLKRHVDDVEIATDTSDNTGNFVGLVEFSANGHPGPVYHTESISGQVKKRSSKVYGTVFPAEIDQMFRFIGNGVYPGIENQLEVFGDSSGMQVKVKTGLGIQLGHLYPQYTQSTLAVTAADATNPRIDRVVMRLTRPGEAEEGKHVLAVVAGTPAAVPAVPALTQSSATWETGLATVAVGAGVSTITAGNVTDGRSYAGLVAFTATQASRITVDSTGAFTVEQADGDDVFNVDTVANLISLVNGGDLRVFSDAYTTERARIDGATGKIEIYRGGDLVVYSDAGVTQQFSVAGATGAMVITGGAAGQLTIQKQNGDDVFNVDTANGLVSIPNGNDLRIFSGPYTTETGRWDAATGGIEIFQGGDFTLYSNAGVTITFQIAGESGRIFIANQSEPSTPTGGGYLYVQSGSLRYKGSSGTITTIAPA